MYTVGNHCIKKFVINEIYPDGYERFATMKELGQDVEWNVHFIEYDEYLESGEASEKKKKGDLLEGNLAISLVTFRQRAEEDFCHHQKLSGYKAVGPYQMGHLAIAALFLVNDRSSMECFTQIYKNLNGNDQFLVDNFIEKYNETQ